MRFCFYYLMEDEPERVRDVAPHHAAYWHEQEPAEYVGGPFADRSGGLITFAAESPDRAQQLVAGDPFVREGLLRSSSLKQWLPT